MKDQTIKRKLYPDDIARAVLFFGSDESSAAPTRTSSSTAAGSIKTGRRRFRR